MKVRAFAAAAALSIVAPLGALASATTASATTVSVATATIRSYIVRNGDGSATLSASYTCPEGFHLWISAKQSADGRYDPALMGEGSSEVSAAWLQSHPVNFTCDGRSHTQSFVIDTSEQGFGTLQRGVAWAQFCLIGENTFIFKGQWVAVI
jgi:hypothetical protein